MAFIGLVPSERSTGDNVRRAGLTLAGTGALAEGRLDISVSGLGQREAPKRLEAIPKPVRGIA